MDEPQWYHQRGATQATRIPHVRPGPLALLDVVGVQFDVEGSGTTATNDGTSLTNQKEPVSGADDNFVI